MPRCGSILQAGTCQIFSIAENPRWSPSVSIFGSNFEILGGMGGVSWCLVDVLGGGVSVLIMLML